MKNRVCTLYRVSTDKQVDHNDKNQADIPMQRKACRAFCDKMGWTIVHEEQEEGVSGHKVRAENREKLQIIVVKRVRYICYGKTRKQTDCNGQTGYTAHILDGIIDKLVRRIFERMKAICRGLDFEAVAA